MFSHICIGVNDPDRAFAFYSSILPILGIEMKLRDPERGWTVWKMPGQDRPLLLIGTPADAGLAGPGNGHMVAFLSPTRLLVDRFYETALVHGATSEGEPGPRPEYHSHYYGAYFRDPEGNKLAIVCHHAEPVAEGRAG